MWRGSGIDDDDEEEVASSFTSSQPKSQDSTSERQQRYGQRDLREAARDESDEDAYDDEDFEGYSDEFESDDEEADTAAGGSMDASRTECIWKVGDLVQVYWDDERAWFDGVVGRVDGTRCFVQYNDGEQQWEDPEVLRSAPPAHANAADQLQQRHSESDVSTLVGRRVVVYWQDERDWFDGRIADVLRANGEDRIHVIYDDGDDQWLVAASFRDVLVLPLTSKRDDVTSESTDNSTGRILTPRPYTPAVETHFEPICVARPYKTTVSNHLGSVITPRSWDRRPYYHPRVVAQLDCAPQLPTLKRDSFTDASRECEVQTEISFEPEAGQPSPSTSSA